MDSFSAHQTDELTESEILSKLSAIKDPIKCTDYEVFFAVLKQFDNLEPRILDMAWTVAFKTLVSLHSNIQSVLDVCSISSHEKLTHQNTFKIQLHVTSTFVELFEEALAADVQQETGRKKKLKTSDSKDYDRYKERTFKCLLQLMSLPISRLLDTESATEEVINKTTMRIAFKLVENSAANGLTKNKDLQEYVFSVLGLGIEKYNQSLSFCIKFMQILQYKEQLAPLLAQLIEFIVTRHKQRILIGELFHEIDRMDPKDMCKDPSCSRAVATFLVELSDRCPQQIVPYLSHILDYLDQESYLIRNASLNVLANIIMFMSQQEEQDLKLRDQLLEVVLNHTKDITSYTRSKALSVACVLSESTCIPLSHVCLFTAASVNRLLDKSCFVRKQAIKFLNYEIRNNPYSKRLPLEALQNRLKEEKSKGTEESEENVSLSVNRKIKYLEDTISFTLLIHKAIPHIIELLFSKNVTDIQEAIEFFITCHEFGIDEALVGFKRMILLVHSEEKSIKDAISAAYKRIFFQSIRYEGKSEKEQVSLVITNLINFVATSNIAEAISLSLLLRQFKQTNDICKAHENELWARFTSREPDERSFCIQILGMLATTTPKIISHNLELCLENGLIANNYSEPNCRLIRETCIALQKASLPKRMPIDAPLFLRLIDIITDSIFNLDCDHWYSICDEIIKTLYKMAEGADEICETIFNKIVESIKEDSIDPTVLARFIHLLGDIALNMVVHLEMNILKELKIRNNKGDVDQSVMNTSVMRRRSRRWDKQEGDDDIGGANAFEDFEIEFLEGICDEEIVCGSSLLAQMSTLILDVAKDPNHFNHPELKQSASLALAKYMMVSEKFCADHLRLLFTILERSKESEIKINLLVAISDLCIRFPNLLDGWTQKIFDCLESHDVEVKRSSLKVISRLILTDNIKVKGQISNIANLMVDEDEELVMCSKQFFAELGKKLNAIYNLLPDVISRLSDSEKGVSEENFRIVMRFLFELIDKDRHIDRLIDKLCHRFTDTIDERHWCDLAFCLSLLKYSDKALNKLFEKFDTYKDKLCIESVHTSIASIITTFRKTPNIKNETKQLLDEFESKLNQATKPADETIEATEEQ